MDPDVIATFSPQQKIAFDELKRRIRSKFEGIPDDDFRIYRFLKARKFDVDEGETMLSNHLIFRQKHGLDTIVNDYKLIEPLATYFPFNFLGYDKEGSLIILLDCGNYDYFGFAKSVKNDTMIRHIMYVMELASKYMKEHAHQLDIPIRGWTWIIDYDNFSLVKATNKTGIDLGMESGTIYELNYPETLKVGLVINAPIYFNYIFRVMKVTFPVETINKIKVFGKDGWRAELLKLIDPEVLPVYLGGKKTDPDGNPRCVTTINHGSKIPKHLYLGNPERRLMHQAGVMKHDIRSMKRMNVVHDVDTPGSFLEWEFECESHDIGFGLFFKAKCDEKLKELIAIQRVNAHNFCQTGTFICLEVGDYIIILDNSHSWFRRKHVFMRSCVREPKL